MSIKLLIEYETPRAMVRGVFLCENVAVSYAPIMDYGAVEYRPYDDQGSYDGDVMVL
jgi:hypothetical protein